MSFLYDIVADYDKSYDTVTDTGVSGTVTTLYGYLSSFDDVLFSSVNTAINEILTFSSVDLISDEYIHYLAYMLGYNWNLDLDYDIQRNLLKYIIEVYKRKGTKFAFHFNLYQYDPTISLYEPYKDLFILDKSKYGEDHLPSRDYYSYGILVIRLNNYINDIFEIIEYLRPAGWKIVIEFTYGIFYSFHIKVQTEERMILENSNELDFYYRTFTTRINAYDAIINTPGDVHSSTYTVVSRSPNTNIDNLTNYVYIDAVIQIDRIYLNNNVVFTEGVDYNIISNNTIIAWTPIGMTKIAPNAMYFVDYIKDDKAEARHLRQIDEYIQNMYVADTVSDQYIYNEFGVPIADKLTDEQYTEQYVNSLVYVNGQFMPITMIGHTYIPSMYQPSTFTVENDTERYALSELMYWYDISMLGYLRMSDTSFEVFYSKVIEYEVGNYFMFDDSPIIAKIVSSSFNITNNRTLFDVSFNDFMIYHNDIRRYELSSNYNGTILGIYGYQTYNDYRFVYNENFDNLYIIDSEYAVIDILKVYFGDIEYQLNVDYTVSNNNSIIWSENGNKPAAEFFVNFTYRVDITDDFTIINENDTNYLLLDIDNIFTNGSSFEVDFGHKIPPSVQQIKISSLWVDNGSVIYQNDTREVYSVIDKFNLDNEKGYQLESNSFDVVVSRASIVPPLSSQFSLDDMGNHHLLYETDDNIYTLFRFSLQYAKYQLLNGDIFVDDGDDTITIPNGISEVYITTCGGGGGSSAEYYISNNRVISTGGGGGEVRYRYRLMVNPGDTIHIVAGNGGERQHDGEASYAELKRASEANFSIITNTYADPGKTPVSLDDLVIPPDIDGIYGISWYGGEAGGENSGAGGSIWSTNTSFNTLSTSDIMTYEYSDYGNNGMSFGGKSIITTGLTCGGGGSYGVGGGLYGLPGYGGGGCNHPSAGNGIGGNGFARVQYDITQIIDENDTPTAIAIEPSMIELKVGEISTLSVTILPTDRDWSYSWYSYDDNVVTVTQNGEITAIGVGETYISVTSVVTTALCTVTVKENVILIENINLFLNNYQIERNSIVQLTVAITPGNATNKTLEYRSTNEDIAVVTNNGVIRAINYGRCNIVVTATDGSNVSASIEIEVI